MVHPWRTKLIKEFPYKRADKTDAPQPIPGNLAVKWPGLCFATTFWEKIPETEPTWLGLLNLKNIAELVFIFCSYSTNHLFPGQQDISALAQILGGSPPWKTSEASFSRPLSTVKTFGPHVSLWIQECFEVKHSFLKRVIRNTHS